MTAATKAKAPKPTNNQNNQVKIIPPPTAIDTSLLGQAVSAVLNHHTKTISANSTTTKKDLLGDDVNITVLFDIARIPKYANPKPKRIDIPHPLATSTDAEVCLICKESQKPHLQTLVSKFPDYMSNITKVLTLESIRSKFPRYEQRRELLHKYDLFLADSSILAMLGKALGKSFFEAKKQPIPVDLKREAGVPFVIKRAIENTYLFLSAGTTLAVRAGSTAMSAEQLAANVNAIAHNAPSKIPGAWSNIRSISIKSSHGGCISLPFYNIAPEVLEELRSSSEVEEVAAAAKKVDEKKQKKEHDDEEKAKRKEKSPLLRALKKQKTIEKDVDASKIAKSEAKANRKEAKETNSKEVIKMKADKKTKTPTKKRKSNDDEEKSSNETEDVADVVPKKEKTPEEEPTETEEKPNRKARRKNKRKQSVDEEEKTAVVEPKSSKKNKNGEGETEPVKTSEKDVELKPKSARKKKKQDPVESGTEEPAKTPKKDAVAAPKSAKKKNKKQPVETETKEPAKKEKTKEDFVASKKFKGAKKGYVFRKDSKGVGYYVDVQPVVDISKLPKSGGGGGGRKSVGGKRRNSSKSPGRRRR
eukprot:CAMPEP_0194363092 /NCGR_PEP_ID=MMETSP0174-20130528/11014_1 /TAXON_ID=216777 /ORGANISM="Proboscia alata, Strain PI-D3" /LENGTH=587 /DNA_ID=CAMNT_0039136431 /DNA_START=113 /DNA_END=1876 /DNA_ORIENTATION=+